MSSPTCSPVRFGQYLSTIILALFLASFSSPILSTTVPFSSAFFEINHLVFKQLPSAAVAGIGVVVYLLVCFFVEAAETHEKLSNEAWMWGNMTPPSTASLLKEVNLLNKERKASTSMEDGWDVVGTDSDDGSSEEDENQNKRLTRSATTRSATKAKKSSKSGTSYLWREERGKSVFVQKTFPSRTKPPSASTYTVAQVSVHNTKDDLWIIIESKAYDVTSFLAEHPGGWLPMLNMGGKDCTDAFSNYHPSKVYQYQLPRFYVGDVVDTLDTEAFTIEHREIRQELLRRGLFETNVYFYYLKAMWLGVLFFSSLCLTLDLTDLTMVATSTTSHLLGAVLMATFWQQLAFVGHDIGHNAISHSKAKDNSIGIIIGNILGGISLGWWKHSHNVHHIVCNSVEHDPDIQHMPIFAVTDEIFDERKLAEAGVLTHPSDKTKGFWSTYHEKWVSHDFASSFLVSYQHWLFYPVMALARFNLYIQGIIFIVTAKRQDGWYAKRFQLLEACTLSIFITWLVYIAWSLPNNKERVMWFLVSHGLSGLLHVQICISHFAMDTYHGHAYNDSSDEWFKMQCNTTMNVDCYRWMDFFHGGLQFQIEHHLFPRLPRHNLREARELVKPFCEKHGVRYHEPGFIAANVELVKGLYDVALKCRKYGVESVGGLVGTMLYEGMNARG